MPDPNPWLGISAADYEGHMGDDSVLQLQALGQLFAEVVDAVRPRRLALPGCTTGNGLERLAPEACELVLAVDLNPEYVRTLRRRFARRLPGLVTVLADLDRFALSPGSFDLVHCALLLEYLEPAAATAEMARWLAPGGVLSVVLQLPSGSSGPVSDTPYVSLKALAPILRLVPPAELDRLATAVGLTPEQAWRVHLPRGKAFQVALYRRRQSTTERTASVTSPPAGGTCG
jgi:SAM-dependent methyltransferase